MDSNNIKTTAPAPAIARIEVKGNDAVRQWIKLKQMYEGMRGFARARTKSRSRRHSPGHQAAGDPVEQRGQEGLAADRR